MAMMNFDIFMYGHRHADCYGNGFCKDVVLSEILNRRNFQTLEEQGKLERYKTRLQRIIRKAKQEYLNITEVNTPTHAICEYSASNKSVALYLLLLGNKIMSQECKSNSINVDVLVFSYVLEATLSTLTPQGKLCFLTRLQRINVGGSTYYTRKKGASSPSTKKKGAITSLVKEGSSTCLTKKKGSSTSLIKEGSSTSLIKEGSSTCLTKKKGATTPVSECYHKDKAQGCDCTKASSHAPSTNKKFKLSFEGVCNDFHPRSKLPEGLLLAQSMYCAKSALAFYNDKYGTEYKLVEPLSSARIYDYGVRFHCNFTAVKLKKDGSRAAQPKLFFANFIYLKYGLHDMYCSIIDPAKAIFWCCEACPPDLAHCHRRAGMYNVLRGSPIEYFEDVRKEVYAEIALDVYNKKHGTEYELVESLETNVVPVSFGTYRFHCNFKAELMTPDNSDGSIKLFFGDVVRSFSFSDGEFCILESTEGLDDHCSICRKGAVFHPSHHEAPYITCASM